MPTEPFVAAAGELVLEPWPLDPGQVVTGSPHVSGVILHESPDGRIVRGVWEHTAGTSRDVEADELFVVLSGRATIAVEDGPVLDVGPGDTAVLRAGDRTVWTVHETLRKVFQTTAS